MYDLIIVTNIQQHMQELELIDIFEAARRMAQALDPADQSASARWERYLRNNRNTAREAAHRIPSTKMGSRIAYDPADIAQAIELEKLRRIGSVTLDRRAAEALAAFGIGQGGTTTGYLWPDAVTVVDAFDEATGKPFVQLTVSKPRLTVYRLELAQASKLANDLANACKDAHATAAHHASGK